MGIAGSMIDAGIVSDLSVVLIGGQTFNKPPLVASQFHEMSLKAVQQFFDVAEVCAGQLQRLDAEPLAFNPMLELADMECDQRQFRLSLLHAEDIGAA